MNELQVNHTERDARRRLDGAGYSALKFVRCQCRAGRMLLDGAVPSYFHKQLAQEVVKTLPGVTEIVNRLAVRRISRHVAGRMP